MVNFGGKLKNLRKEKNLTQQQLADRVGVTKSIISAYECGLRFPSRIILLKIAEQFRVSTDYLLDSVKMRSIDITGLCEDEVAAITKLVDLYRNPRKEK